MSSINKRSSRVVANLKKSNPRCLSIHFRVRVLQLLPTTCAQMQRLLFLPKTEAVPASKELLTLPRPALELWRGKPWLWVDEAIPKLPQSLKQLGPKSNPKDYGPCFLVVTPRQSLYQSFYSHLRKMNLIEFNTMPRFGPISSVLRVSKRVSYEVFFEPALTWGLMC